MSELAAKAIESGRTEHPWTALGKVRKVTLRLHAYWVCTRLAVVLSDLEDFVR